jgi:hypothetical protein
VQAYVAAAKAMQEAGKAMSTSLINISTKLGDCCTFKKNVYELADVQYKLEAARSEWLTHLEVKTSKTLPKAMDADAKDCATAQKNMKKALGKYGKYVDRAEKMTKNKKAPAPAELLSGAHEETERGRSNMVDDMIYQCNRSYLTILTEWCAANEEQLKAYAEIASLAENLKAQAAIAQNVPKPESPVSEWESIGDESSLDSKVVALSGGGGGGSGGGGAGTAAPPKKKKDGLKGSKTAKPAGGSKKLQGRKSAGAGSSVEVVKAPPPLTLEPRSDNSSVPLALQTPRGLGRVRAKWTFAAVDAGDLSMQAGDILVVLSKENPNWYLVYLNGKQGNIPSNYVEPVDDDLDLPPPPAAGDADCDSDDDDDDDNDDNDDDDDDGDDDDDVAPAAAAAPGGGGEWQEFTTPEGHKYLYNAGTGETKWA